MTETLVQPIANRAGQRETLDAMTSLALVGLHVADDSFLQPQPGGAPSDQPGERPPAARAPRPGLAAFAYTHVAGAGGAIALVVGRFGVVFGSEALAYTARVGPSGDDFTGFPPSSPA